MNVPSELSKRIKLISKKMNITQESIIINALEQYVKCLEETLNHIKKRPIEKIYKERRL